MSTDHVRHATDESKPSGVFDAPETATPTVDCDPDATTAAAGNDPQVIESTRHLPALCRPTSGPTPGSEPVANYRLARRLGQGGFGEVWEATGPGGVSLALKLIRLDNGTEQGEVRALEFMKTIHHPQLVGIAGVWQTAEYLVIAMELADSTMQAALDKALEAGGEGIEPVVLGEQMREAAKGIDYLNSLGIVHRDIKPQNLLLMGGGIKVADYGLARLLESSGERSRLSLTPSYAAPELCRGEVSGWADQYSLAVSYCELRGGRLPFQGHHWQVMQGHMHGTPDLSMVPEADRPVVARALSKEPAARWPDCRSFVAALPSVRVVDAATPFLPEPVSAAVSRRSFLGALTGAASLAGAAIGSAAWTRFAASSSPSDLAEIRRDEIRRDLRFLRSRPYEPIRQAPSASEDVDQIAPHRNDAFTILEDERVIDLRGWRDLADNPLSNETSAITMTRTLWVRKQREATALYFPGRTSGRAIFFESRTPAYQVRQTTQRRPIISGNQRMHAVEAMIDVADVPVGNDFTVSVAATYWDSLQTPEELWMGVIGYGTASKVSQLIAFPEGKPFRTYQLRTSKLGRDNPSVYDGRAFVLAATDRDWINWDIHHPEDGLVYRIDWTW